MKISRSKFEYIEQRWLLKNKRFKIKENKYIYIYSLKQFLQAIYGFGEALLRIPFQMIIVIGKSLLEVIECLPLWFKDLWNRTIDLFPIKYIEVVDDKENNFKEHPKGQYHFE